MSLADSCGDFRDVMHEKLHDPVAAVKWLRDAAQWDVDGYGKREATTIIDLCDDFVALKEDGHADQAHVAWIWLMRLSHVLDEVSATPWIFVESHRWSEQAFRQAEEWRRTRHEAAVQITLGDAKSSQHAGSTPNRDLTRSASAESSESER